MMREIIFLLQEEVIEMLADHIIIQIIMDLIIIKTTMDRPTTPTNMGILPIEDKPMETLVISIPIISNINYISEFI